MITNDQILPSLYHLQRLGTVGEISVCARRSGPVKALAESPELAAAFPGHQFTAYPDLKQDTGKVDPDLYKKVLAKMPPRNLVIVAVPDPLHHEMIIEALKANQHVLAVKPLVLKYEHAVEIEKLAHSRGLFVGVEYHKRFDVRALEARKGYRAGRFGEFKIGEAKLVEPYYYRHSNFQNWFTCEATDPFTYIGCHYVDMVYFITGLRPTEVSVQGVKGKFPNGNVGYMWASGRVGFENGALLSILTGLGYPDEGAGSNDQGLCMFFEGDDRGGYLHHDDQYRGVSHSYADGKTKFPFKYVSPEYFKLVPWQGEGLRPTGYGYWSVEGHVQAAIQVDAAGDNLRARQRVLDEIDQKGIIATPKNSNINELVVEATRLSIANNGRNVIIEYGEKPHVRLT